MFFVVLLLLHWKLVIGSFFALVSLRWHCCWALWFFHCNFILIFVVLMIQAVHYNRSMLTWPPSLQYIWVRNSNLVIFSCPDAASWLVRKCFYFNIVLYFKTSGRVTAVPMCGQPSHQDLRTVPTPEDQPAPSIQRLGAQTKEQPCLSLPAFWGAPGYQSIRLRSNKVIILMITTNCNEKQYHLTTLPLPVQAKFKFLLLLERTFLAPYVWTCTS